ncbi:MAG: hypothetical protein KF746_01975 [Chitinophagaceae bacterium]|nr:hypothetical protein [Chitinophagaceae bacterium]
MKFSFRFLMVLVFVAGFVSLANTTNATAAPYPVTFRTADITDHPQKNDSKADKESKEEKEVEAFRVSLIPVENAEAVRLFLQKEEGKRLSVRLKSPGGDALIYFHTDKKPANIYRKLNFTDAPEGVYTVEVSDGKQTIVKKIVLERTRYEVRTKLAVE